MKKNVCLYAYANLMMNFWLQARTRLFVLIFALAGILGGIDACAKETAKWAKVPVFTAREGTSIAFDSDVGIFIFFGGYDGKYSNETWLYNPADNIWTCLNPITPPSPRAFASMAYDSYMGNFMLFGGQDPQGLFG